MSYGAASTQSEGSRLADEIKKLPDDQVFARAAEYQARLRRGRALIAEGQMIVDRNINPFVICQNELHHRTTVRIEHETDLRG